MILIPIIFTALVTYSIFSEPNKPAKSSREIYESKLQNRSR